MGISTCPCLSAWMGPNWRPATRMVTLAPLFVWKGKTVEPSSGIRVQPCTRRGPLLSSKAITATRGTRSDGGTYRARKCPGARVVIGSMVPALASARSGR